MAYDKVVDSAKLDAGMTATANAIRAKTGGTGKIPWDSVTGFKTAVEAIQTDVESAVVNPLSVTANGTYTVPDGVDGYNPVTVNVPEKTIALQEKSVTPTQSVQSVTADNGYDGLKKVTVDAIPSVYQDTSSVTATAADVLTGKVIVLADGTVKAGTMADNGAVNKSLDATTVSYTIPAGRHSGTGKVTITLEEKTVTPTKSTQTVTPTAGKVLSKVTVAPIPAEYITTTDATATAANILDGKTAYVGGNKIEGTMPNNGTVSGTVNGITTTEVSVPAGYTSGGKITFDDTKIAEMLDAI